MVISKLSAQAVPAVFTPLILNAVTFNAEINGVSVAGKGSTTGSTAAYSRLL
jgi:hypothetical protein